MDGELSAVIVAAVGIALSPLPLVLAVALVGPDGLVTRATTFVAGEALAVGAVCAAAVFALQSDEADAAVPRAIALLEIAIGSVLVLMLVAHAKVARRTGPPRWQTFIDGVGASTAFVAGAAMILLNPKNLVLSLAGATAILQLGYSTGGEIAGVVTFTVASVSVLAVLLVLARAFPKQARSILDRVRSFIVNHERVLVAVLLGVLAAFFLVRGAVETAS